MPLLPEANADVEEDRKAWERKKALERALKKHKNEAVDSTILQRRVWRSSAKSLGLADKGDAFQPHGPASSAFGQAEDVTATGQAVVAAASGLAETVSASDQAVVAPASGLAETLSAPGQAGDVTASDQAGDVTASDQASVAPASGLADTVSASGQTGNVTASGQADQAAAAFPDDPLLQCLLRAF